MVNFVEIRRTSYEILCMLLFGVFTLGFIGLMIGLIMSGGDPELHEKICDPNCLTQTCEYTACNGPCEIIVEPCTCYVNMGGTSTFSCQKMTAEVDKKSEKQIMGAYLIMIFGFIMLSSGVLGVCICNCPCSGTSASIVAAPYAVQENAEYSEMRQDQADQESQEYSEVEQEQADQGLELV